MDNWWHMYRVIDIIFLLTLLCTRGALSALLTMEISIYIFYGLKGVECFLEKNVISPVNGLIEVFDFVRIMFRI